MENFKKVLKKRIFWGRLYAILALFIIIAGPLIIAPYRQFDEHIISFTYGFFIGIEFVVLTNLIKYQKALKNSEKAQNLYIEETDERTKAIRAKAGMPLLPICSLLMITASMIVGYFSNAAFISLVIAALVQLLISGFIKIYYQKNM